MLTHQIQVIINPMSSGGITRLKWLHIKHLLEKTGLKFDYVFTEKAGHATHLARAATMKGYELIIAVGGDGTVHEVVNGLVDVSGHSRATLGLIATGTGNDFARSIGLLQDYRKACTQFTMTKKICIDIGLVEYSNDQQKLQRLFVNMAGVGLDAAILEATKKTFRVVTKLPYWISGLYTFATYNNKNASLSIDGISEKKRIMGVIINNGCSFAGGMRLAPDASISDGLFDTIVIGNMNRLEFAQGLSHAYKGTLATQPKISIYKAKEIEVKSEEKLLIEADGELLGETPVRFTVLPQALNVAVFNAYS